MEIINRLLVGILAGIFLAGMPAQMLAIEENGIISTEKKMEIPPGMEEEWGNFKERYGEAFTSVEWDFGCACVRELYGYYDTGRGELKSEAEAEALAREFLSENAGLFKADFAQLKIKKKKLDRRGGWKIDYEQYYDDIHVYRGVVRVLMSNKSYLRGAINDFYLDINISTETKITKEKAVEIVETLTHDNLTVNDIARRTDKTVLFILPKVADESLMYYLTWRVPTHSALHFVDAVNGEIIYKQSTVAANGEVEVGDGGGTDMLPPAQTEAPSNSHSTIPVGLAALAIAVALIIIWRLKK
ncbi:MAG: hypothetical protein V3R93_06080 [Candidatus Hydrothermarchaeaceae archaeon]